jgi:hypothetical protein
MYNLNEILIAESVTDKDRGSLKSSSNAFDLPRLIKIMKHEKSREKGELMAMVLLKSPVKKILLALLDRGTEIRSYQKDDSIAVEVIEGKLELIMRHKSFYLKRGEILTLDEKIKYKIYSVEETAFLMTISSGN